MKLFKKGLLLVAIPGLFELGLLGVLYKSQENATQAEARTLHTKDVIIQAAEVREPVLLQSARLRAAIILNDPGGLEKTDLWESIEKEINELRDLVVDNPAQLRATEQIRASVKEYRAWTDKQIELLRSGRRDDLVAELRDPTTLRLILVIQRQLADFIKVEGALDDVRQQRAVEARRLQNIALWVALLGSVLAAAVAAKIFSKDVGGRLAVLTDNARQLSEGGALATAVGGSDEITELDRVLHETHARLKQAEDNARVYREQLERHAGELALVNEDLQRQTQDNEMFIYSVSHDLRSPLVNLQGFSKELHHSIKEMRDTISDSNLNDNDKKRIHDMIEDDVEVSLKFIRTAVSRSASIIDSMLRLSRVGRVEYQSQMTDVNDIVGRVIDAMSATIRQREAVVLSQPLPACYGDPTAIEQIFGNLIGNAINYLDPKRPGTVRIGVLPSDPGQPDFRTYYVKDNGLGIPADYLGKMFSAFNRLHADVAQGEGVGLALIKRIVMRHGGKIWVESTEGVGTTFYTSLPVKPADSPASQLAQGERTHG
ncbi:bacteriophytochrome (light-regulated signal transduction histidine kinase) [Herbaspirillum sp. CF444]|uniref:sensor histidine kinase n=1 Tax=Herbaspirillum sp. CF444 TaxID=1144319 RepID=UPI000272687E|nr:ATP-binding protein [Herbaspirillum sp. CF444]EJL92821.1 bacteriophytochrome (light-regulated signal transduction histidine kinase) [Herbaspirillum sp. CF444]